MLTVAAGCDKQDDGPPLASRPPVLFQVFGAREDPRVIPVAFVDSAGLRAMELTPAQWREFDSLYTRGGDSLHIYHQARVVGSARVQRGMWERDSTLYALPGCVSPIPQAAVRMAVDAPIGNVVEFLATSAILAQDTTAAHRPMALGPALVTQIARSLASREARSVRVPEPTLDSLDFRALASNTGSTRAPTIVTSFVDPSGGDGGRSGVRHFFVIGDQVNGEWVTTYRNVYASASRSDPLRRYVDRLDVTGDGVSEIFLEEWTLGGGARPVVLTWRGGRWEELWRGRDSWCLATDD